MNPKQKSRPCVGAQERPGGGKCNPAQFHRPQFTTQKGVTQ